MRCDDAGVGRPWIRARPTLTRGALPLGRASGKPDGGLHKRHIRSAGSLRRSATCSTGTREANSSSPSNRWVRWAARRSSMTTRAGFALFAALRRRGGAARRLSAGEILPARGPGTQGRAHARLGRVGHLVDGQAACPPATRSASALCVGPSSAARGRAAATVRCLKRGRRVRVPFPEWISAEDIAAASAGAPSMKLRAASCLPPLSSTWAPKCPAAFPPARDATARAEAWCRS